jgi:hypothetical protein
MSSNNNRVQKSDANLVDVIHTNSGSIANVKLKMFLTNYVQFR